MHCIPFEYIVLVEKQNNWRNLMINKDVQNEILSLSSGTMASLTGKTKYSEIDEALAEFLGFAVNSETKFNSWQEAWNAMKVVIKHYVDEKYGLKGMYQVHVDSLGLVSKPVSLEKAEEFATFAKEALSDTYIFSTFQPNIWKRTKKETV